MARSDEDVVYVAKGLRRGAIALEVMAFLTAIGGLIGGVAVAMYSETQNSGTAIETTTQPWVGLGISFIAGALVIGVFIWCIGCALRLFAVDAAARHGATIEPAPVSTTREQVSKAA